MQVNEYIQDIKKTFLADLTYNSSLNHYFFALQSSFGKCVRPKLLFYSAHTYKKPDTSSLINVGTALELLHLSSLVHDDIMDHADTRRGEPSIPAVLGYEKAVGAGDVLLGKAFFHISSVSIVPTSLFALVLIDIWEGQLEECLAISNLSLTKEAYQSIIQKKTASLIRFSCVAGGHLSNAPDEGILALGHFGERVGLAFQIVDDLLDYEGDEKTFGKCIGTDVKEGKVTLPLIYALEEDASIGTLFLNNEFTRLLAAMKKTTAFDRCRKTVEELTLDACGALLTLPDTPFRAELIARALSLLSRKK